MHPSVSHSSGMRVHYYEVIIPNSLTTTLKCRNHNVSQVSISHLWLAADPITSSLSALRIGCCRPAAGRQPGLSLFSCTEIEKVKHPLPILGDRHS